MSKIKNNRSKNYEALVEYINKDNKVVICFPKYAIAPGYMGELEFIIDAEINN